MSKHTAIKHNSGNVVKKQSNMGIQWRTIKQCQMEMVPVTGAMWLASTQGKTGILCPLTYRPLALPLQGGWDVQNCNTSFSSFFAL